MKELIEIFLGTPLGVVTFLAGFFLFLLGLLPIDKIRIKRSALISEPLGDRTRWILGVLGFVFMVGPVIAQATYVATAAITPTASNKSTSSIEITEPANTEEVINTDFEVAGAYSYSNPSADVMIWVFVGQVVDGERTRYWLQRDSPTKPSMDGTWRARAFIDAGDVGKRFEIYAIAVDDPETNNYLLEYAAAARRGVIDPFLGMPPLEGIVAWHQISVTKIDIPLSTSDTSMPTATATPKFEGPVIIIPSVTPPR